MKKMLILGDADSIFIKDFVGQYAQRGYIIDLISLGNGPLVDGVRHQRNCILTAKFKILTQIQIYIALFRNIRAMDNDYDSVIIHFVAFTIGPHIYRLKRKGQTLVAVVWGSDFYRVSSKIKIFFQDLIYASVDRIVFTSNETKVKFEHDKKNISCIKTTVASFGLPVLDEIDKLKASLAFSEWCLKFNVPTDKIKVMVGYNANLAHQQLLIIDKIAELDESVISRIHLIFPLGYGSKGSGALIESKLHESGLENYTILENFYNFHDIARLRKITDILINIQPSDQFSGSMQETLYAGGRVIAGSWLPYRDIVAIGAQIHLIEDPNEIAQKLEALIANPEINEDPKLDVVRSYIHNSSSWMMNLKIWDSILFSASPANKSHLP
jgi:hypothetical protein